MIGFIDCEDVAGQHGRCPYYGCACAVDAKAGQAPNGELAFPVSEVTIAGNLVNMLQDLEFIGSDLEFRGSTAAPTLCIREMTVGGR